MSEIVTLTGLVRWASVPPADAKKPHPEAINKYEPDNCSYEIEVECTEAQLASLLAKADKKIGDDYALTLRRYPADVLHKETKEIMATKTDKTFIRVKATKQKGDLVFKDIPVVDLDGNPIKDKIANDSRACVAISVEPTKKGSKKKSIRLKAVQVIELIKFEGATSLPFKVNAVAATAEETTPTATPQAQTNTGDW